MVTLTLKQLPNNYWVILAPKGHIITGPFYAGDQRHAEDFCRQSISWIFTAHYVVEKIDKNEKKSKNS